MNANAKKWLAALRSGSYKQTTDALRRGDSFCCLGVVCELYAKGHPKMNIQVLEGEIYLYDRQRSFLPPEVRVWLGMRIQPGFISAVNEMELTKRNDKGDSFASIADFIETEQAAMFE